MKTGRKCFDWTEERLDLLRTNYPKMTAWELAELIGCSERTIGRMATSLGLEKDEIDPSHLRMFDVIREQIHTRSNMEIARTLHVTEKTIRRTAKKFGLKRTKEEESAIRSRIRKEIVRHARIMGMYDEKCHIHLLTLTDPKIIKHHRAVIVIRSRMRQLGYIVDREGYTLYYDESQKRYPIKERHALELGLKIEPYIEEDDYEDEDNCQENNINIITTSNSLSNGIYR